MYLSIVSIDETMNLWVIIDPTDFIKTTGSRWRSAVQLDKNAPFLPYWTQNSKLLKIEANAYKLARKFDETNVSVNV